jgi:hypothetical protein
VQEGGGDKIKFKNTHTHTHSNMSQKAIYKSKHAFQGSSVQSQLSFVAGETIIAEMGQTGAWWWGRCGGVVSFMIYLLCVFVGWE